MPMTVYNICDNIRCITYKTCFILPQCIGVVNDIYACMKILLSMYNIHVYIKHFDKTKYSSHNVLL